MSGHIKSVNPKEIMLDNILATMSKYTFGKYQAAEIVGGESKLLALIADGSIECEKTTNSQNGKWFCNAAQECQPTLPGMELFHVGSGYDPEQEAMNREMERQKKKRKRGSCKKVCLK